MSLLISVRFSWRVLFSLYSEFGFKLFRGKISYIPEYEATCELLSARVDVTDVAIGEREFLENALPAQGGRKKAMDTREPVVFAHARETIRMKKFDSRQKPD